MVYISDLHKYVDQEVTLKGWVSNKRTGGKVVFIVLRDGSGYTQCIVELENVGEEVLEVAKRLTLEAAVSISGTVVLDERQEGGFELKASAVELIHAPTQDYPISKKAHGVDFLMNNRHLWLRSKKQWAIMRVRNRAMYAIHQFFQERGFLQMDAPLLTGNACEGTTTLFATDFYEKEAFLSQSGQLYGEAMAMAFGKIYTFGPTFRAEKSVTPRHLSEFWMIEPEMAFYDLDMDMELIEDFVKSIVNDVFKDCKEELEILERDTVLFENINQPFPRVTYMDACKIIRGEMEVNGKTSIQALEEDLAAVHAEIESCKAEIESTEAELAKGGMKKGKRNYFQSKVDRLKGRLKKLTEEDARNIPEWIEMAKNFPVGEDFGSAHEKALTRVYGIPIMVYKWPKNIKAFYMKTYDDDPEFVKGVDLLAPEGFGELVGGSERETDFEILKQGVIDHELPMEEFEWYLDLRRYGSVTHAGFGLGFERLIMWLTGVQHIRETIPFPRYYGRLFP